MPSFFSSMDYLAPMLCLMELHLLNGLQKSLMVQIGRFQSHAFAPIISSISISSIIMIVLGRNHTAALVMDDGGHTCAYIVHCVWDLDQMSKELLWTWTLCSRELAQTCMKGFRTYLSGMQRPFIQVFVCQASLRCYEPKPCLHPGHLTISKIAMTP
jgi:hypothetical protein